jgi:hypothetical protein
VDDGSKETVEISVSLPGKATLFSPDIVRSGRGGRGGGQDAGWVVLQGGLWRWGAQGGWAVGVGWGGGIWHYGWWIMEATRPLPTVCHCQVCHCQACHCQVCHCQVCHCQVSLPGVFNVGLLPDSGGVGWVGVGVGFGQDAGIEPCHTVKFGIVVCKLAAPNLACCAVLWYAAGVSTASEISVRIEPPHSVTVTVPRRYQLVLTLAVPIAARAEKVLFKSKAARLLMTCRCVGSVLLRRGGQQFPRFACGWDRVPCVFLGEGGVCLCPLLHVLRRFSSRARRHAC